MATNTNPIFGIIPYNGQGTLLTANTALDGTGTLVTIFVAHATYGGYFERAIMKPLGNTVSATAIRFFLYHPTLGTSFIDDYTLPAAVLSAVAAMPKHQVTFNLGLAAGEEIRCAIGTTVSAGWDVTGCGSHYSL